jgi:hypothetical protein
MIRRNFLKGFAGAVPALVAGSILGKQPPVLSKLPSNPHPKTEPVNVGNSSGRSNGWRESITLRGSASLEVVKCGSGRYEIKLIQ